MKKEDFLATTSYAFRSEPVDREMSLFILGTDTVTNTVLMELLQRELEHKNGRFYLAVSDFASLRHSFPELANNERIIPVIIDTYEFIKALSEAGRIFTIWYIPHYFVKKAGQIIYMVCSKKRLKARSTLSVRARHYIRTANNADYFIKDEVYDNLYIKCPTKGKMMAVLMPSIHRNPKREADQFMDIRSKLKKGRLVYGISTEAWDYCKSMEDTDPNLLKDTYPYTHSLKEIFEMADVIVSANDGAAAIAERSGKDSIFFGKTEDKLSKRIVRSLDVYDAVNEGYKFLSERNSAKICEPVPDGISSNSIGLGEFIPINRDGAKKCILIAGDWTRRSVFGYLHRLMAAVDASKETGLDVFFPQTSRKDIDANTDESLEEMNMLIYEGICQYPAERIAEPERSRYNNVEKEDLKREWQRILGGAEYDELWLIKGTKLPVKGMEEVVPANRVRTMDMSEMPENVCEWFMSSGIELKRPTIEQDGILCSIEGEEFYHLGKIHGKEYCISKKAVQKPYVLIKYDEAGADQIRKELADIKGDEERIIIVGTTDKAIKKMTEGMRAIVLPMEFAPPELIGSSSLFITSDKEIEYAAAKIMSVPVRTI